MFKFKYRPDPMASEFTVTCEEPLTNLGIKSAGYYQFWTNPHELRRANALGHYIIVDKYLLWSYVTPIAMVTIIKDTDSREKKIIVNLNETSYRCSRTTIMHVSKFFDMLTKKYKLGYGLTYLNIKKLMQSVRMHFFFDCMEWIEQYDTRFSVDCSLQLHRLTCDELESKIAYNSNVWVKPKCSYEM